MCARQDLYQVTNVNVTRTEPLQYHGLADRLNGKGQTISGLFLPTYITSVSLKEKQAQIKQLSSHL